MLLLWRAVGKRQLSVISSQGIRTPLVPWKEVHVPITAGKTQNHIAAHTLGEISSQPVVLLHGITSNAMVFSQLARHLDPKMSGGLISVDLRGRGHSYSPSSPEKYGMRNHTQDLRALFDHFNIASAIVVGHSYGGFVAEYACADAMLGGRISGVVLVDSGFPRLALQDAGADQASVKNIQEGLQKAFLRLNMLFDSPEAYLKYWFPDTPLQDLDPDVYQYHLYELEQDPSTGKYRSNVNPVCPMVDMTELQESGMTPEELSTLRQPMLLFRCLNGFSDGAPPMLSDPHVDAMRQCLNLTSVQEGEYNHYTVMQSPHAQRVAAFINDFGRKLRFIQ